MSMKGEGSRSCSLLQVRAGKALVNGKIFSYASGMLRSRQIRWLIGEKGHAVIKKEPVHKTQDDVL